jgi:hypothetical protein
LAFERTTQLYILVDSTLYNHCYENVRPYKNIDGLHQLKQVFVKLRDAELNEDTIVGPQIRERLL